MKLDVFKLQEDFSEHEIRVFFEKGLGSFLISYFTYLRQTKCATNILKTFLKTRLKTNHVYLDFAKYLVVSFPSHSKRTFSVFLEYSLRIISET
jgi:hypothetical protein